MARGHSPEKASNRGNGGVACFLLIKCMFTVSTQIWRWCPGVLGIVLACAGAFSADPAIENRTVVAKAQVLAGEPCTVEYTVEWQGARDACIVLPLDVTQPEWGAAELKTTRTEHDGERWRVAQVVAYTAKAPGRYTVAPVEMQLITANQPIVGAFESTPATRVKMDEVSISVVGPTSWKIWGTMSATVLLAICVGFALLYRRRREAVSSTEVDVVAASRELLHDARRCRLDGDLYPCYQTLLKSAEVLQTVNIDAKGVADAIRRRIPAVGFQGVHPSDDEMDGLFRDIERIIARRNSPPVPDQEKQPCR